MAREVERVARLTACATGAGRSVGLGWGGVASEAGGTLRLSIIMVWAVTSPVSSMAVSCELLMRKGKGGAQVPGEGHTMDGNRNTPMTWQHLDNGVAKGGWHAVGIMENGWVTVGAKWDGKSRVGRP